MKYLKRSATAVLAAAALMTFAVGASATELTSPAGTAYKGAVKAETEGEMVIHELWIESRCKSRLEWETPQQGPGITAAGPVKSLSLFECSGNTTVVPLKFGTFEIHTWTGEANGSGTLTWLGAQITILTHLPFLGTIDCVYGTAPQNADVGVITGSSSTGGTARIKLSATLIRLGGSQTCPTTSNWTALYEVKAPDYLDVD